VVVLKEGASATEEEPKALLESKVAKRWIPFVEAPRTRAASS